MYVAFLDPMYKLAHTILLLFLKKYFLQPIMAYLTCHPGRSVLSEIKISLGSIG